MNDRLRRLEGLIIAGGVEPLTSWQPEQRTRPGRRDRKRLELRYIFWGTPE